jgi:hypothetical protein
VARPPSSAFTQSCGENARKSETRKVTRVGLHGGKRRVGLHAVDIDAATSFHERKQAHLRMAARRGRDQRAVPRCDERVRFLGVTG